MVHQSQYPSFVSCFQFRLSQQHEAQTQDHGLHYVCCSWSHFGKVPLSVSRPICFFSLFSTLAHLPELSSSDIIRSRLKPEFWDTCLAWSSFLPSLPTASVTVIKTISYKAGLFWQVDYRLWKKWKGALVCINCLLLSLHQQLIHVEGTNQVCASAVY